MNVLDGRHECTASLELLYGQSGEKRGRRSALPSALGLLKAVKGDRSLGPKLGFRYTSD